LPNKKRGEVKEEAIHNIQSGKSYATAARHAGVTQSTVIAWCRDAGVHSTVRPWGDKKPPLSNTK